MKKALPLSFTLLAAVTLAGCANDMTASSGGSRSEPIAREMPYKPGTGVVQSWAPTPGSAAAGTSGRMDPTPGTGNIRMAIKMDDGGVQYIDTDSRDFPVGTRVRLTENRIIERP